MSGHKEDSPLSEFQEGQWWVKELDAMVALPGVSDQQKRAVAVVHHMLRAAAQELARTDSGKVAEVLTLQQIADRIGGTAAMSPVEFRTFLNGDGVMMLPHQIAFMINLFAAPAADSATTEQAKPWTYEMPAEEMRQKFIDYLVEIMDAKSAMEQRGIPLDGFPEMMAEMLKRYDAAQPAGRAAEPVTFEQAWAEYEKRGYHYGGDALENVRFGWKIAVDILAATKQPDEPHKTQRRIKQLKLLVDAYGPKSLMYDFEHPNDGLNSKDPAEVERTMRGAGDKLVVYGDTFHSQFSNDTEVTTTVRPPKRNRIEDGVPEGDHNIWDNWKPAR